MQSTRIEQCLVDDLNRRDFDRLTVICIHPFVLVIDDHVLALSAVFLMLIFNLIYIFDFGTMLASQSTEIVLFCCSVVNQCLRIEILRNARNLVLVYMIDTIFGDVSSLIRYASEDEVEMVI